MIPSMTATRQFEEETTFDATTVTSVLDLHGFSLDYFSPGPHYADTGSYLTAINQANFESLGMKDSLASSPFFDSIEFDTTPGPSVLTPGHNLWIEYDLGPMVVGDPVMNGVPRTSDENSWDFMASSLDPLPIPYSASPDPQTMSLGQDVEENIQTSEVSPAPTLWGVPPIGWGIGQQETNFSFENPPFWSADPASGIDSPMIPGENIQRVNPTAVQSTPHTVEQSLQQQQIYSTELVHLCKWKGADGVVCGEPLTRATLPEHLSKHGIKNQRRDRPTKCNWDGCRKTRSMNRESIVRHIREVHMHIKRHSKPVQRHCSRTQLAML